MLLLAISGEAGAALRIEVLRGEGGNNNGAQNLGSAPVVRLLDTRGKTVADVLVVFTAPDVAPSVTFSGQGSSAQAITDESGIAAAPRERPMGDGPVEIRVMASVGGEFANTVIHQMNLGTGAKPNREGELTLTRLAPSETADPAGFGIRVEDGAGKPVPAAAVAFVLRQEGHEVSRVAVTADANGEAFGGVPARVRKGRLEVMVQAESNGRRVTDYFLFN